MFAKLLKRFALQQNLSRKAMTCFHHTSMQIGIMLPVTSFLPEQLKCSDINSVFKNDLKNYEYY